MPRPVKPGRFAFVLVLLPLVIGCRGGADPDRAPLGEPEGQGVSGPVTEEARMELDSANAAFRSGDLEAALAHYRVVTRMEPELAAGWYGVGMTQEALGNAAAADSAMMRAHRLAPEIPLRHPTGEAPANPHPVVPHPLPRPDPGPDG